jgi:hypothetical protein
MEQRDNLDRFLDHALTKLADATPQDGLEQRILANLMPKVVRRSNWHWAWIAVPALAALMLLAVLIGPKIGHEQEAVTSETNRQETRIPEPPQTTIAPTRPKTVNAARIRRLPKLRSDVIATAKAEPRLATFPSSDENEQQARMLLRFVVGHPAEAKEVVLDEQRFQELAQVSLRQNWETGSEK